MDKQQANTAEEQKILDDLHEQAMSLLKNDDSAAEEHNHDHSHGHPHQHSHTMAELDAPPSIYINGVEISSEAIQQELQYQQASSAQEAITNAAQALCIRELLRQAYVESSSLSEEFANEEWKRSEEECISALLEAKLVSAQPSEEEARQYYEKNPKRFSIAPAAHIKHILLAARNNAEDRMRVRDIADDLLKQLEACQDELSREVLFTKFVEEFSACRSAKNFGDLGQISAGDTVPEFENVVFTLGKGLATSPIETRHGWHIVLVKDIIEGEVLPYEKVKSAVEQLLSQQQFQHKLRDYLCVLIEQANIQGIQLDVNQHNTFYEVN